jgi:hypothetical protein
MRNTVIDDAYLVLLESFEKMSTRWEELAISRTEERDYWRSKCEWLEEQFIGTKEEAANG